MKPPTLADIYPEPKPTLPTSIGIGHVLEVNDKTYLISCAATLCVVLSNTSDGTRYGNSVRVGDLWHLTKAEVHSLLHGASFSEVRYLGHARDVARVVGDA